MSLVYPASKWTTALWQSHVTRFPLAQTVLTDGSAKQAAFPSFAQSCHDALYLRHIPQALPEAPDWATTLLSTARELPEWHTLRARCQANAFASGLANQTLLETLLPLIPEEEKPQPSNPNGQPGPQAGPGATEGHEGMPGGPGGPQPAPGDGSATRRALRQACREASQTIDDAEAATDALGEALGRHQGHGPGSSESLQSLDEVRSVYALLQTNKELQHIAALAGRLVRLGQAHKKTIVTPAVGAIKGIEIGGMLERLLPSELVGLRSPARILKLKTLNTILGKRALQYKISGVDSETRGPLCVLIDESGSMGTSVDSPSVWAKAVNLALLTIATQQRRAWHMIGFTDRIRHEHSKGPQETLSAEVLILALSRQSSGGTSFEEPLARAIALIRQAPTMRKSDIVWITDGEASLSPALIDAMLALRKEEGAQVYAILIGDDAHGNTLAPIATEMYRVSTHPQTNSATVAPLMAKIA